MSNRNNRAPCLAVLGTGSDVGKSVVSTALCRILNNRGVRVAPFKAQNMSNNSYVTPLGGEMGRAQIVQAEAARVIPHVDMNPVLLKPSTDTGAQVVLHGKPIGSCEAADYFHDTDQLFEEAMGSLNRLREEYEFVVMEGAGSCGEVNLRRRDFVNFRTAHAADAPVVLIADIDRGGVFAQLIGTMEVIPADDRARIKGFIINRFRGDAELFTEGITYIEQRTGLPVFGLIPYYRHIEIESEDGLPLDVVVDPVEELYGNKITIAVIRLPHISNFTDFFSLSRDPRVTLHYLAKPRIVTNYDIVFLPGSKNVRWDLEWLRDTGWTDVLAQYRASGGEIGGICGGYQMLGRVVRDPYGVEGAPGETRGLEFLPIESTLQSDKTLSRSSGTWKADGTLVEGYEIHMGTTERMPGTEAVVAIESVNDEPAHRDDGAISDDSKVWGTYLHGLFDSTRFRYAFLRRLRPDIIVRENPVISDESAASFKEQQYNLLAQHFEDHLDMERLLDIAGLTEEDQSRRG